MCYERLLESGGHTEKLKDSFRVPLDAIMFLHGGTGAQPGGVGVFRVEQPGREGVRESLRVFGFAGGAATGLFVSLSVANYEEL